MRLKDLLGLSLRPRLVPAAFLAGLLTPALVFAQQTDDFVPVDPADPGLEQLPAAPMVMAAYGLVWLILIGYVWSLRRRQARVELEMAALRARISERPDGPDDMDPRRP